MTDKKPPEPEGEFVKEGNEGDVGDDSYEYLFEVVKWVLIFMTGVAFGQIFM